jgi:hypothetical protein
MLLDDHFGSASTEQRNERVKLAASFWNNVGAGHGHRRHGSRLLPGEARRHLD